MRKIKMLWCSWSVLLKCYCCVCVSVCVHVCQSWNLHSVYDLSCSNAFLKAKIQTSESLQNHCVIFTSTTEKTLNKYETVTRNFSSLWKANFVCAMLVSVLFLYNIINKPGKDLCLVTFAFENVRLTSFHAEASSRACSHHCSDADNNLSLTPGDDN